MKLLDLVYETAIAEGKESSIAEKMCHQIHCKFLLGEINICENNEHIIVGWFCVQDTKRQNMYVLPTL